MMGKEERERGKKGRNKEMGGLRWNGFEIYTYVYKRNEQNSDIE